MNSTRTRRTRGAVGLPRALSPVRRARDERGASALMELVIFIGVIATTMAWFTSGTVAVSQVQRGHQAHDVVTQYAHGVLEKAKTTPWGSLALVENEPGYAEAVAASTETVVVSPAALPDRQFTPVIQAEVDNIEVDLLVTVTWIDGGGTRPAGDFGTKKVTVHATWRAPGSSTDREATFTLMRTPGPAEKAPTGVVAP